MKYIGVNVSHSICEAKLTKRYIFPFSEDFVHSMMAEYIQRLCWESWPNAKVEIVTAGFADVTMFSTTGESESLGGLKSDPLDERYFNASYFIGNIIND